MITKIEDIPLDAFKHILKEKFNINFNPNLSFEKLDIDDLDSIEFLMELEKYIDDSISDDLWDHISTLDDLSSMITENRNKKINSII
jgi:acyl carrier protein